MKRTILIILSLLITITGFGCVALSKLITPAEVDKSAVKYAVEARVADTNDYNGYHNLYQAESLVEDVDAAHTLNQLQLQQAIEKDSTQYSILKKSVVANRQLAVQREEALFGEKGLLSLGLTMAGFGSFTGLLGLMRKRPGDLTKEEVESTLAAVTGKSTEQLNTKERQFVQLVKGLQEYIKTQDGNGNKDAILALKGIMDKYQDTETKIAVAAVKKKENV